MSGQAVEYIEIDIPYCALTYGVAPCQASLTASPPTGTVKCFNSLQTCQDLANIDLQPVTLRFARPAEYLPRDIDALPWIKSVDYTPAIISLGVNLGQRATLKVTLGDHAHSDAGPGLDKYHAERAYDPYQLGTFFGRFRARQPYMRGVALRWINGFVGQALADMETRYFFIDRFQGPGPNGIYELIASDTLKLLDGERSKAPALSGGFLVAAITAVATSATLSPAGIGAAEYPASGYVCIGGKEVCAFTHDNPARNDANTLLLLHCDGVDAATVFTDSSPSARAGTAAGNAQIDTAQFKFGLASGLFDGSGDRVTFPDSAAWTFSGDFTIDFWARHVNLSTDQAYFGHATDTNNQYYLWARTTGVLTFSIISGGAFTVQMSSAAGVITAGAFHHIAITRSGTVWRLFVNGVEVATTTDADAVPNFTGTFHVGDSGVSTSSLNGWLDEFRVSDIARWTTAFTPPTSPYLTADELYLTRGQLGTTATAHTEQDRVQLVLRYAADDAADILYDLMTVYGGVPASYITLADWQAETGTYLNRVYTATIVEPTAVNALCSELIEQAALVIWDDNVEQKLRLQVLHGILTDAAQFSESEVLENTLTLADQPEKRLSQVWVYFGQIDPTKSVTDLDNYRSTAIVIDADAETNHGTAIKKIPSRWTPQFGRTIAERMATIHLGRYSTAPRRLGFSLLRDGVIAPPALGNGYRLEWWNIQDETGARASLPFQLTRLAARDGRYLLEAEEMLFSSISDEDLDNRNITIDFNTTNLNLRTIHDSLFPAITSGQSVTFTIMAGIIVGSTSTALPAVDVGSWPAGVIVNVVVIGRIQGKGGKGGTYPGGAVNGQAGFVGGPALYTRFAINLTYTSGKLWSGAGGGGSGGVFLPGGGGAYSGCGGGGAAGSDPGDGGSGCPGLSGFSDGGSPGTTEAGGPKGTGGTGGGNHPDGGNGGGPGLAGSAGQSVNTSGGAGGLAGAAIDGVSFVTVIGGAGDIRGGQIN